jgi:hypothetical protein
MGAYMSKEKVLLTREELTEIEAEVQREIDTDLKEKARETTKADMLQKARVARGLAETSEIIEINLPEHADRITINSFPYMHGRAYEVKGSMATQLRETMHRAWEHQAVVEGRRKDFYTKRQTRMSGSTGAVTNAPFLRA